MRLSSSILAITLAAGLVLNGCCKQCKKEAKAAKPETPKAAAPAATAPVAAKPAAPAAPAPAAVKAGPVIAAELKFKAGDTDTYKVTTETAKDYKFEEPSLNKNTVQQTLNSSEVTFDQKIDGVDPAGVATATETITAVHYVSKNPQNNNFDIDSTKTTGALARINGQSYTIKIAPDGNVVAISDTQKAMAAVTGDTMEAKVAQSLLSDDVIKQRHAFVKLPGKDANMWTALKGSPAGMLMPRSYEKVYTVKEITKQDGDSVAVVDMDARPSSMKAADMPKDEQKGMGLFAKMFDNQETYKGKLMLDISKGKVLSYDEKLKSDWVATEPAEEVKSDKGPDVLTMGFTHVYQVQKVK
jgi:hypothetical protein